MKKSFMIAGVVATICLAAPAQKQGTRPGRKRAAPAKQGGLDSIRIPELDYKDTDIRDIARSISKGYGINIVFDDDVDKEVKVTIHLTNVPVLQGLTTILDAHGLELKKEGDIYRVKKAEDKGTAAVRMARRNTINLKVENRDVRDFIQDISSKTGLNIIAEKEVKGRISGNLQNVDVEDGVRTLLEANGYDVRYRGDIMLVMAREDETKRGRRRTGRRRLDIRIKEDKVWLDLQGADLGDALKEIAEQSKLNMVTYGAVKGEVNAKLSDMPMDKAVSLLVSGTKYTFAIKDGILLVGDRNAATPSGQALSTAELVHLKHVKAEGFPKLLPKTIPAGNVQVIKEQNAILVTGTTDILNQVKEFISEVDIPTPQIMIEAVVVEYVRSRGKDVGIEARTGTADTSGISIETYFPGFAFNVGSKTLNQRLPNKIGGFQFGTVGFLPDDFMLRLHALARDKKANILAQPRIATLNGHKASINVGVTSYFKLTGGNVDNPITKFQTIQSGIKLHITPWISKSGQVTAEITPEISNTVGINQEGFPDVSTRNVNTTVRLNNGETIIIGGLIRTEEQNTADKLPVLGDIPVLGKLFQSRVNQESSSELVIYITPHILNKEDHVDLKADLERFQTRAKKKKVDIHYDDPLPGEEDEQGKGQRLKGKSEEPEKAQEETEKVAEPVGSTR